MMEGYGVFVSNLEGLGDLKNLAPKMRTAAFRAINKTTVSARTSAARRIRDEVAFPASYLQPGAGRLVVSQKATEGRLEARIRGQGRPTSLARFSTSGTPNKAGVTVVVQPGKARRMRRAFLIRLPQGKALTETKFNLGLAIRLRPGESVQNKTKQVRIGAGLYLLYGPSVDQVFDDVALKMTDEISQDFAKEYYRLLDANF